MLTANKTSRKTERSVYFAKRVFRPMLTANKKFYAKRADPLVL
jgi:hypothetical protein